MAATPLLRVIAVASLVATGLAVFTDAAASPNYYSGDVRSKKSQLRVVKPEAGTYTAGEKLLISWRKSTPGTDVTITVHMATGSGARGAEVASIDPPPAVKAEWKQKGGALYWTIPKSFQAGRYVIQVRAGSFLAASESFIVDRPKVDPPKLGEEQAGPAGAVQKVKVEDRGKRGTVVLKTSSGEDTYEWGRETCPVLEGGLPGALIMLSKLDDAVITPRVREVTFEGKTTQRCIVGVESEKPLPDVDAAVDDADAATPSE